MHYREGEVKSLGVFYPRRAWGHARKIGKSSGGVAAIGLATAERNAIVTM